MVRHTRSGRGRSRRRGAVVRDSDGRMATQAREANARWMAPTDTGARAKPAPTPWPGFGLGLVLGREISHIDWHSTLYYWLDNSLYVNAEGMRAGQFEFSSGTNQLQPPRLFT